MEKKEMTKFVLDEEEEFVVDVEKKKIKGTKKEYTADEFKEKSKEFPIVVIPLAGSTDSFIRESFCRRKESTKL